jgi:hypothetical protein
MFISKYYPFGCCGTGLIILVFSEKFPDYKRAIVKTYGGKRSDSKTLNDFGVLIRFPVASPLAREFP